LDAAEYATRLADDRERLPHLDASAESDGVEASFGLSYAMLDEADREGLGALSVCPQDFDRAAAAALWALSERDTDARIGRLVRLHLLEPSGSGASARYRFHDLVRLFVRPRLEPAPAAAVAMRHAEHFIGLLVRTNAALQRERQDDDTATEDLAAADREWTHITAAIEHCRQRAQDDARAAELCCQASRAATILRLRVDPRTRIGWLHTALRIAVDRADRSLEGKLSVQIARAHQELGDPRRAIELCEHALALIDEDDHATRVSALVALGDAHHAVGDPQRSIESGEHALALAREIGARREEAEALVVLAWGYRVRGDLARTLECCEQSLPITREFRDRSMEASALLAKAFAHQARGERDLAHQTAEKSARMGRDNGDRRVEGYALIALGERDGRNHFQECLEIARETGDRRMAGNAQLALGFSHTTAGRMPDAIHAFEQALAVAVETTDKAMEGTALTALGFVYIFSNEIDRAIAVLGRDEELSRSIGNRSQQAAAAWLLSAAYQRAGLSDAALAAEERYRALSTSDSTYPGLARMQRALGPRDG
jgi:tetratricopeptide (TPR) repeat protein